METREKRGPSVTLEVRGIEIKLVDDRGLLPGESAARDVTIPVASLNDCASELERMMLLVEARACMADPNLEWALHRRVLRRIVSDALGVDVPLEAIVNYSAPIAPSHGFNYRGVAYGFDDTYVSLGYYLWGSRKDAPLRPGMPTYVGMTIFNHVYQPYQPYLGEIDSTLGCASSQVDDAYLERIRDMFAAREAVKGLEPVTLVPQEIRGIHSKMLRRWDEEKREAPYCEERILPYERDEPFPLIMGHERADMGALIIRGRVQLDGDVYCNSLMVDANSTLDLSGYRLEVRGQDTHTIALHPGAKIVDTSGVHAGKCPEQPSTLLFSLPRRDPPAVCAELPALWKH